MMLAIEIVLLVCLLCVLWRLMRGPTPWDRVMAYNSASNRVVTLLALTAVVAQRGVLLDVVIVYVALSFLGIVILARFMERSGAAR